MRVRVTLSAKVAEVNFTSARRGMRRVGGVSRLPGLRVRNVFARFTETSRCSEDPTVMRLRQCLSFSEHMRRTKIRVPLRRYSGDTNVVHVPRTGLGVIHTKVAVCKVCPSSRIRESVMGLRPIVRLGDRIACIGSIPTKTTVDCNNACITSEGLHITAIPINCTSNCSERLSGGN